MTLEPSTHVAITLVELVAVVIALAGFAWALVKFSFAIGRLVTAGESVATSVGELKSHMIDHQRADEVQFNVVAGQINAHSNRLTALEVREETTRR